MIVAFLGGSIFGFLLAVGFFCLVLSAVLDEDSPKKAYPHVKDHITSERIAINYDAQVPEIKKIIYH
jgi:hypothetical protein